MRDKDFSILFQGGALGFCLGVAGGSPRFFAASAAILLLCSLVLTVWRLR